MKQLRFKLRNIQKVQFKSLLLFFEGQCHSVDYVSSTYMHDKISKGFFPFRFYLRYQ